MNKKLFHKTQPPGIMLQNGHQVLQLLGHYITLQWATQSYLLDHLRQAHGQKHFGPNVQYTSKNYNSHT